MKTRAVFLDALGTLVDLEPPWIHLASELQTEPDARLIKAVRAEMDYYKAHAQEGRDDGSLAELRGRCAGVLSAELGTEISVETMMASIRFRAYPDAQPALATLRGLELELVCVSNWDVSLPDVLRRCGLDGLLDGAVSSAAAGARKPDPAIFTPALELAACEPAEALVVGDTREEDLAGARAAGIPALLLDRDGGADIASLTEVPDRIQGRMPA